VSKSKDASIYGTEGGMMCPRAKTHPYTVLRGDDVFKSKDASIYGTEGGNVSKSKDASIYSTEGG
jgi:hypothetical protein